MCRHAALARGALRVRHGVADLRPCASQRSSNAALSAVPGTRQHPEVPPHRLSLAAPGSTRQQTRQTQHPANPATRQRPGNTPATRQPDPATPGNPATRAQILYSLERLSMSAGQPSHVSEGDTIPRGHNLRCHGDKQSQTAQKQISHILKRVQRYVSQAAKSGHGSPGPGEQLCTVPLLSQLAWRYTRHDRHARSAVWTVPSLPSERHRIPMHTTARRADSSRRRSPSR